MNALHALESLFSVSGAYSLHCLCFLWYKGLVHCIAVRCLGVRGSFCVGIDINRATWRQSSGRSGGASWSAPRRVGTATWHGDPQLDYDSLGEFISSNDETLIDAVLQLYTLVSLPEEEQIQVPLLRVKGGSCLEFRE